MKYTEQQIIKAMKGTGGIVSQIISNLTKLDNNTISRQALHERIGKSETLKEAYEAEQEHIGDIAETGFFLALQAKEDWAIKEWFKYKGYTRGYVQNKVIENKGKDPVVEILKAAGLTGGEGENGQNRNNDVDIQGTSKNTPQS